MICYHNSQIKTVLTAASRNRCAKDLIRTRFSKHSGALRYRGAGRDNIINDQDPLSLKARRRPDGISAGNVLATFFGVSGQRLRRSVSNFPQRAHRSNANQFSDFLRQKLRLIVSAFFHALSAGRNPCQQIKIVRELFANQIRNIWRVCSRITGAEEKLEPMQRVQAPVRALTW